MDPLNLRLREEHEDLNFKTLRLVRVVATDFDWWDLDLQVIELGLCLERHLTREEGEDGFARIMPGLALADQRVARRLLEQHGTLRKRLQELRHSIVDQSDRAAVRHGLEEWIGILTAHERAENQLFRSARPAAGAGAPGDEARVHGADGAIRG